MMPRLLFVFLALLLPIPLLADTTASPAVCAEHITITGTGRAIQFDNRATGCTYWRVSYSSTGFTALTIDFENAPDNSDAPGTWSTWTSSEVVQGALPLTSTSIGEVWARSYRAWVSVNVEAITGSGSISIDLLGFTGNRERVLITNPAETAVLGDVSNPFPVAGTAADGAAVAGNPIRIGGKDGSGNAQDIATDTAGELQVDVLSSIPGTGATNLGKAEDVTSGSGDTGVAPLLVREDTPTSTVGANGEYIAAKANLWGHQFVTSVCQDPNLVTSVVISTATSGNVELVALTASQTIYVCSWDVMATGTVAVQMIYGTGTACATGETNLTGAYPLTAQAGLAPSGGGGPLFKTAVSNALCIELSAAIQVDGRVTYVKF